MITSETYRYQNSTFLTMPIEKLIYTPSNVSTSAEHPHTFVMMVDEEMYEKQKNARN